MSTRRREVREGRRNPGSILLPSFFCLEKHTVLIDFGGGRINKHELRYSFARCLISVELGSKAVCYSARESSINETFKPIGDAQVTEQNRGPENSELYTQSLTDFSALERALLG